MERRERLYAGNNAWETQAAIEGSKAMNLASYETRERRFTDEELYDDIVSYLGEYRLNIQKYTYQLKFIGGQICDKNGEPMIDKAKRAIDFKKQRGEPTYREEAEFLGLQSGGDQLRIIKNQPAAFFWASPPGPKEEGYGNYGFLFAGNYDPLTLDISMTAVRIEDPKISQFNNAMSFLTGRAFGFSKATDFLSSPVVLRGEENLRFTDKILQNSFSFKENSRNLEISSKVFKRLEPKIEEFIKSYKHLSREERLTMFHTLENYAISLKERFEKEDESGVIILDDYREDKMKLYDLSGKYGHKPPTVAGSCGGTGNTKSNGLFNFGFEALMDVLFGEESSVCSVCGGDTSDGHYHCPNEKCKKRYADETNKSSSDRTKECSCGFEFGC